MASVTNFAENKIVDALLRGQALGAPATWYYALFTSDPTEAGGGTEVTGAGYARVAVAASLANFAGTQGAGTTTASSGTGGATSNNGSIAFGAPTANWSGPITHVGVMDASTAGNCWIYSVLETAKTVNNGDAAPSFPAGDWTLTVG
jgi:hypothetical protein